MGPVGVDGSQGWDGAHRRGWGPQGWDRAHRGWDGAHRRGMGPAGAAKRSWTGRVAPRYHPNRAPHPHPPTALPIPTASHPSHRPTPISMHHPSARCRPKPAPDSQARSGPDRFPGRVALDHRSSAVPPGPESAGLPAPADRSVHPPLERAHPGELVHMDTEQPGWLRGGSSHGDHRVLGRGSDQHRRRGPRTRPGLRRCS
jgi:hypothetical protein